MKIYQKTQFTMAMTRLEILGITCVILVSIGLATHYLRTGEFLEVSWQKTPGYKPLVVES